MASLNALKLHSSGTLLYNFDTHYNRNKKQDDRLPTAYFMPSHFGRKSFERLTSFFVFFFQNTLCLHQIFIFSNFEIFPNFGQKSHKNGGETFLRSISISDAFYEKIGALNGFENIQGFFSKKTHLFSQEKTQILNLLRNLTIPAAFYRKFATIRLKNSRSETWTNIV